jgi:hypothetical protein
LGFTNIGNELGLQTFLKKFSISHIFAQLNAECILRLKLNTHTEIELRVTAWGSVNWIHLAHDRDKWFSAVNTARKLQCP